MEEGIPTPDRGRENSLLHLSVAKRALGGMGFWKIRLRNVFGRAGAETAIRTYQARTGGNPPTSSCFGFRGAYRGVSFTAHAKAVACARCRDGSHTKHRVQAFCGQYRVA